ncbi:hypothetical protein [Pseudalkalibacillus sp. SCS-8]|uniref:hypothetical protein n=1 Tax=Pseudalkalibacillus nanhaiensis TaxID=3115291 RepID=UPI0039C976DD
MNKRTIILTDQENRERAQSRKREIEQEGCHCTIYQLDERIELKELLSSQPLGTKVVILADDNVQTLRQLTKAVGFTNRDITVVQGEHESSRIFCSQCHHIQKVPRYQEYQCSNCQNHIEPSDHFSAFHQAYLGYPVFK